MAWAIRGCRGMAGSMDGLDLSLAPNRPSRRFSALVARCRRCRRRVGFVAVIRLHGDVHDP